MGIVCSFYNQQNIAKKRCENLEFSPGATIKLPLAPKFLLIHWVIYAKSGA